MSENRYPVHSSHPVPTPSGRGCVVTAQPRPGPYRDGVSGRRRRGEEISTPSPVPAAKRDTNWTSITIEQYRALDDAGRLRRPLTDRPVGHYTSAKREAQEQASAAMPTTPSPGGPR